MSLILYIITALKFIAYVVIHSAIVNKIIFGILLFFLQYKLKNSLNGPRNVSLVTYKIKNFIIPIIFVSVYILVFIILLSIYRISAIDRTIDLKQKLLELYNAIQVTNLFTIAINIILLFLLVISILYSYRILKTKFILEFTKLYIYFYRYTIFRNGIFYITYTIINMPIDNLYLFLKDNYNINCIYCRKLIENLGFILLIIFFFYDIIFNNMVITKIYYIIPFAYLYTQIFLFKFFAERRHIMNDILLSKFYYIKHVIEGPGGVYLENGDIYTIEDIQNLQEHILQDFKI